MVNIIQTTEPKSYSSCLMQVQHFSKQNYLNNFDFFPFIYLRMAVGVVRTDALAGRDALGGGGGSVLGGILQPLDDLALDGSSDRGVGRAPQVLGGPLESLLALSVVGPGRAHLGGLDHLRGGVRQLLGGGEQSLL